MSDLNELVAKATEAVEAATEIKALEDVRVSYLGKKGELTALLKGLGKLSAEERPAAGAKINEAKQAVQTLLEAKKQTLEEAESRWRRHRNYEFFYLPYCDYAFNISHEETDEDDFTDAGGDDDDAVRIANDTLYGLSGYISSGNLDRARKIASRMRTGMVHINGAHLDSMAPFGGYKQSGNGREWGPQGIEEFLEVKSIYGYEASA